jgi:predicted DNA-binding protein with PD1-like motif
MKYKVVEDADVVTYVVVCDPGDEAVVALTQFAQAEDLEAASIAAVGAFEHAVVGWFDRAAKDYRRIPVGEQCEVLSLLGDVAQGQDGPILHMHAVLGLSDGTTRGGHLLEGTVFPTLVRW